MIRALRFSTAPGFLEHKAGRKRAQREIHPSLSTMLADHTDGDIRSKTIDA
jgi:hypothetical protein